MIYKQNIPEYSVTEFNKFVRNTLESNFGYIKIRGEIGELKTATKGQIYLTIKDADSILSAVIWESKINLLSAQPEIGMEVIAIGKITTWSRYKTTYQLDIDNLEIAGEGALLKLIEKRKKRLSAKGIFDNKYKKSIPFLPNKIGIITSPSGSVIHDILNRLKERFPVNIDLWPTPVQGKETSEMIIKAIEGFNANYYSKKPDVIVIARGGGSVEDLMSFNDENLAITVFKSRIPIVTAIGHETDTTIIDLAGDLRVSTPTAAIEKIVPVRKELILQLNTLQDRLINSIKNKFSYSNEIFLNYIRLLKDPKNIFNIHKERFSTSKKNLYNSFNILINKNHENLKNLKYKLKIPNELLTFKKAHVKNVSKNLDKQIIEKINNTNLIFENIVRLLKSNSIESNLKKGYVLLKNKNKIIKRSIDLNKEANIKIKFFDKTINAEIKKN